MANADSKKAIVTALVANLGIAITKFAAWIISGAASMLAEAVHSLADSGNQLLLLVGAKRATKKADQEHPFGYGRASFVYAFVVSIILFSVGGMFSVYHGIQKFSNPEPLTNWWLPVTVLVIAVVLESFALRTAVIESNKARGKHSWLEFVRRSKAPELPVILLEDTAALLGLVFALFGVGMTQITGNGTYDAIATLMIGLLLIAVAIVLGIETKSLLIGEGVTKEDSQIIARALLDDTRVQRIIHMKTLYLGPEEFMLGAKLALAPDATLRDVADTIDSAERRIRGALPAARVIYIEPDIFTEATTQQHSTK